VILILDSHEAVAEWVRRLLPETTLRPCTAIGVVDGQGRPVAGVLYHRLDHEAIPSPHIEMTIASTNPRWCTRGVLSALFGYPFNQLKARRVTAIIARRNKRARKFVVRLGFQLEGTLRRGWAARSGDKAVVDAACIYAMFPDRCRWIEKEKAA